MGAFSARALGGERLELVPLRVGHAEEMAGVLADPGLHAFTGGAPDTLAALRSRYRRMLAGSPDPAVSWLNWVIRLREPSCLVGTVQATLAPSGDDLGLGVGLVAEVAWVVGAPWQGRGIATEAAGALVGWLVRQPVDAVVAHIHPGHRASAAVASAVGLVPTGEWQDGEIVWRRIVRGELRGSGP